MWNASHSKTTLPHRVAKKSDKWKKETFVLWVWSRVTCTSLLPKSETFREILLLKSAPRRPTQIAPQRKYEGRDHFFSVDKLWKFKKYLNPLPPNFWLITGRKKLEESGDKSFVFSKTKTFSTAVGDISCFPFRALDTDNQGQFCRSTTNFFFSPDLFFFSNVNSLVPFSLELRGKTPERQASVLKCE